MQVAFMFVCLLFVCLLFGDCIACLYEAEGEGNWDLMIGILGNILGLTGVAGGLEKN